MALSIKLPHFQQNLSKDLRATTFAIAKLEER